MRAADFRYELPAELIAQSPTAQRKDSRLLCLGCAAGEFNDRRFTAISQLLRPGDLLVVNDTRVIPARLYGHKPSGGKVEVLLERVLGATSALAQVRANRAPVAGTDIVLDGGARVTVAGRRGEFFELGFDRDVLDLIAEQGHTPLPPYIKRADDAEDRTRYQTVYADQPGAVAAPTAGLHFDRSVLNQLRANGVDVAALTLHVGAGTFAPLRDEAVASGRLHPERLEVSADVCAAIERTRKRDGRVVAVGTTTVRGLETAGASGECEPFSGDTELFIVPGYTFRIVDAMITNFHLPESSLLMLVCAFAGTESVLSAYRYAVQQRYRFFSYGDAMYCERQNA